MTETWGSRSDLQAAKADDWFAKATQSTEDFLRGLGWQGAQSQPEAPPLDIALPTAEAFHAAAPWRDLDPSPAASRTPATDPAAALPTSIVSATPPAAIAAPARPVAASGVPAAMPSVAAAQASGPAPEAGGDLHAYARAKAQQYGVDPDIFERQITQESGFNPRAVSPAGARGIAQFMPATAAGVGLADPFEPYSALDAAARHMRQNLDRNGGDYSRALAAYNAGQGAVDQYGGVPPFAETRQYIRTIMGGSPAPNAGAVPPAAPAAPPAAPAAAASPPASAAAGVPAERHAPGALVTVRDQWGNTYQMTEGDLKKRPGGSSDLTIVPGPAAMQKTSDQELPDEPTVSPGDQKRARLVAAQRGDLQYRQEVGDTPRPGTDQPIQNQDGSVTTERSITVTEPGLNGGRATNIPTVWDGRIVSDDEAVQNAIRSGIPFQAFNSIDEAVRAAEQRSRDLGAGQATSVGGANVPPEVQNAMPNRNRPVRGGPLDEGMAPRNRAVPGTVNEGPPPDNADGYNDPHLGFPLDRNRPWTPDAEGIDRTNDQLQPRDPQGNPLPLGPVPPNNGQVVYDEQGNPHWVGGTNYQEYVRERAAGQMYRQPLGPNMGPDTATGQEYDPRDADQGAHEAGYTDGGPDGGSAVVNPAEPSGEGGGNAPLPSPAASDPGGAQFAAQDAYSAPQRGSVSSTSDEGRNQEPFTPPPGLQAVYDAGGRFLHWIQGAAQGAADQIGQNMAGNRQTVETANAGQSGGVDFGTGAAILGQAARPYVSPGLEMLAHDRPTEPISGAAYDFASDVAHAPASALNVPSATLGALQHAWQATLDEATATGQAISEGDIKQALWSGAMLGLTELGAPFEAGGAAVNAMLPSSAANLPVSPGTLANTVGIPHDVATAARGIVQRARGVPQMLANLRDLGQQIATETRGAGQGIRGALDANAERVGAADARMAETGGSATANAAFGITPNGPQRSNQPQTVEVLQQRLAQARGIVDRVIESGDPQRIAQAQENRAAIESQLVDAQNARRDLEPRIRSEIGTRIEQVPDQIRGPDSIQNVQSARGEGAYSNSPVPPNFDQQPLARDDVPRDPRSINLNAGVGTLPNGASTDRLGAANRVLGQGLASTFSGGAGAAVAGATDPGSPQGENESDTDYAIRRARERAQRIGAGFAAGALLPLAASKGAGAVARRVGAEAGAEGGALAALGNLPNNPQSTQIVRNIARQANRPQVINGTVTAASSKPANLVDVLQGYRHSVGMLGNIGTGLVNAMGGPVSIGSGLATDVVRTGILRGYPVPAIMEAGSLVTGLGEAAKAALGTAIGRIDPAVRAAPDFRPPLNERMAGAGGKVAGHIIEAPGRLFTQTPDAFFGTLFNHWGERRAANEIMAENGISRLDPAAQVREVQRLLNNPTPDEANRIADGAKKFSDELTYKGKAGYWEDVGSRPWRPSGGRPANSNDTTARQIHDLVGSFVMPFYGSIFKIHKLAATHIPLVGSAADTSLPYSEKVARQLVGLGFGIYAADLAAKGLTTGPGPSDPDEKARLKATGWDEWSTYIPGVGYTKTDNLAQAAPILKSIAAYYDAKRYGNPSEADALKQGNAVVKNILSAFSTFPAVQAAQAVFKMGSNPIEGAADLGTAIASSFVPAMVRAKEASDDPYQRTVDPNASMGEQIKQRALNRLGSVPGIGSRQDSPPALNRETGDPMPNPRQGIGAFIPQPRQVKDDPLMAELSQYGVNLDQARSSFTITAAGADSADTPGAHEIKLTPAHRQEWLRYRRESIDQTAEQIKASPDYQKATEAQRRLVWRSVVTGAEKYADGMFKANDPQRWQQMVATAPAKQKP